MKGCYHGCGGMYPCSIVCVPVWFCWCWADSRGGRRGPALRNGSHRRRGSRRQQRHWSPEFCMICDPATTSWVSQRSIRFYLAAAGHDSIRVDAGRSCSFTKIYKRIKSIIYDRMHRVVSSYLLMKQPIRLVSLRGDDQQHHELSKIRRYAVTLKKAATTIRSLSIFLTERSIDSSTDTPTWHQCAAEAPLEYLKQNRDISNDVLNSNNQGKKQGWANGRIPSAKLRSYPPLSTRACPVPDELECSRDYCEATADRSVGRNLAPTD